MSNEPMLVVSRFVVYEVTYSEDTYYRDEYGNWNKAYGDSQEAVSITKHEELEEVFKFHATVDPRVAAHEPSLIENLKLVQESISLL